MNNCNGATLLFKVQRNNHGHTAERVSASAVRSHNANNKYLILCEIFILRYVHNTYSDPVR